MTQLYRYYGKVKRQRNVINSKLKITSCHHIMPYQARWIQPIRYEQARIKK